MLCFPSMKKMHRHYGNLQPLSKFGVFMLIFLTCLCFIQKRKLPPDVGIGRPSFLNPVPKIERKIHEDGLEAIQMAVYCASTEDLFQWHFSVKSVLHHTLKNITFHVFVPYQFFPMANETLSTFERKRLKVHVYQVMKNNLASDHLTTAISHVLEEEYHMVIVSRPTTVFLEDVHKMTVNPTKYNDLQSKTPCLQYVVLVEAYISAYKKNIDSKCIEFLTTNQDYNNILNKLTCQSCSTHIDDYQLNVSKQLSAVPLQYVLRYMSSNVSSLFEEIISHGSPLKSLDEKEPSRPIPKEEFQVLPYCQSHPRCSYFVEEATSSRTVIYYFNSNNSTPSKHFKRHDITIVTHLQYNRLSSLKRLADTWDGHLIAVVYVNATEAIELGEYLQRHPLRPGVDVHIVFKRGSFYVINFLRNIGIRKVKTSHLLMLDVDFVPNRQLYTQLLEVLPVLGKRKVLIIPTFKTDHLTYEPVSSKDEFMKTMDEAVFPYSYKMPVDNGHQAHNYSVWITASEPYRVDWQPKFEPYIIIPTSANVYYSERLLERMKDKFTYIYHVIREGYEMWVLHDAWLVHIKHELSKSHVEDSCTKSCGEQLYQEEMAEIDEAHTSLKAQQIYLKLVNDGH